MKKKISEITSCPIANTLDLITGRWTFSIVYILMQEGKKRFNELEKIIGGINTRMLVRDLKKLEKNGMLTRTVFPTVPPTVEYELTEKGLALKDIMIGTRDWGKKYL